MNTDGLDQGQKMDYIISNGLCQQRQIDISAIPGNGWNVIWYKGLVIANRETEASFRGQPSFPKYTIYCMRYTRANSTIVAELIGNSSAKVKICVITMGSGHYSSRMYIQVDPVRNPYEWQKNVIAKGYESYENKNRWMVLLCGDPGEGKTEVAISIAAELKKSKGVDPIVVEGFSLTKPGLTMKALPKATLKNPVILSLGEIDTAFAYAENDENKEEKFFSMAQDPSSLAHTLDLMNRMDHLIVVGTSNKTLEYLRTYKKDGKDGKEKGDFYRYIRRGRFDECYQVETSDKSKSGAD